MKSTKRKTARKKKRKTKNSPTQRTLAELRKQGFTAQVVERWNPFAKVRQDLFGCIDVLAIKKNIILGVQACMGDDHAKRRKKALKEPKLKLWLQARSRFEIWSWRLGGPRGERKTWTLRRQAIILGPDNRGRPFACPEWERTK